MALKIHRFYGPETHQVFILFLTTLTKNGAP